MKKITTFILVLSLTSVFINAQTVITVDNSVGSNAQFSDLQSAIDAASNNDIIYVHASEINYGNIIVDKPITLIGFGHSNPIKNTFIDEIILEDNASNSTFSGIRVFDRVYASNGNIQLNNIVFENSFIDNIDFESLTFVEGSNNIVIRGCIVQTISGSMTNAIISNNIITNRIFIGDNYQSVVIKNNLFYRTFSGTHIPISNSANANGTITIQNCIFYDSRSVDLNYNRDGVTFENCLTYNRGTGGVDVLNGSNNLDNQDPLFINDGANAIFEATIDDYHLQAGSPAIGTGVSGEDIGLFNVGAFVFNNFGFTAGVPTVAITAITNVVLPGGTVEVTIQSNSN